MTLQEFLTYQNRTHRQRLGCDLPDDDLELEKLKFSLIDSNKTGTIEWWEFLTYETVEILNRRSQVRPLPNYGYQDSSIVDCWARDQENLGSNPCALVDRMGSLQCSSLKTEASFYAHSL